MCFKKSLLRERLMNQSCSNNNNLDLIKNLTEITYCAKETLTLIPAFGICDRR